MAPHHLPDVDAETWPSCGRLPSRLHGLPAGIAEAIGTARPVPAPHDRHHPHLEPDQRQDVLVKRHGRPDVVAKNGTWFITTRGMALGDLPERHLMWLTKMLHSALGRIQRRIPDVKVDMSLLVHDPDFRPSDLPRKVLKDATSLGEREIEADDHDWLIMSENVADYFRHGLRSEPRYQR